MGYFYITFFYSSHLFPYLERGRTTNMDKARLIHHIPTHIIGFVGLCYLYITKRKNAKRRKGNKKAKGQLPISRIP